MNKMEPSQNPHLTVKTRHVPLALHRKDARSDDGFAACRAHVLGGLGYRGNLARVAERLVLFKRYTGSLVKLTATPAHVIY